MRLPFYTRTLCAFVIFIFMFTSCSYQKSKQAEEEATETHTTNQLTREQVDSLNAANKNILSQEYNAFSIDDTVFQYTYQYQAFFDTTVFFAIEGDVEDIISEENQKTLIIGQVYFHLTPCRVRMSIPSELFNARFNDFFDSSSSLDGLFIVKFRNIFSLKMRTFDSRVTDYGITDSGELDFASAEIFYDDEPTLFLYGELIDFYLNRQRY